LINYACSDTVPEVLSTTYTTEKTITHDSLCTWIDVIEGENLVFKYVRDSDKSGDDFEDDFYEELLFEIPEISEDSFVIQDSLFDNYTLIYLNRCVGRCRGEYIGIQNGEIRGIRMDSSSWDLTIDVDLVQGNTLIPINIQEQFSKAEF